MNNIRLVIKAKNNKLMKARERLGLNQSQMAELCGVEPSRYSEIENLKEYPVTKYGEWKKCAHDISSGAGIPVEDLFPEAFAHIKQTRFEVEMSIPELGHDEIVSLEGPEAILLRKETSEQVEDVLGQLTPREAHVLRLRFGMDGKEQTLSEIGYDFLVSKESIRHIEAKALRKLRHPSRAKLLESAFITDVERR